MLSLLSTEGFGLICSGCRSHMINIVTLLDGRKYMIDVGFGGNGPVRPLLLDSSQTLEGGTVQGISPAEMRLVHENIPENEDRNQRLWSYQHRKDPQAEWVSKYCFTELEFLPADYEIMNFWTSQSPKTLFKQQVLAVKMLMEHGELVGTVMLVDAEVKKRVRGQTEYVMTCRTESERVQALEELFGIRLEGDERRGIRGMFTALRD